MDNLPKEENTQQPNANTGEIFSNQPQVGYQDVIASELQASAPQAPTQPYVNPKGDTSLPPQSTPQQPTEEGAPPVPPFAQDTGRKYIIFAIVAIIIILVGIFLAMFLLRPQKPRQSTNITLNYWGLWDDKEIVAPLIEEYKRNHPNITINYTKQNPKLYRERLESAIDKGESPDIFRFHNSWVPMLINRLSPMPKTVYSDEEFTKIFYPVIRSDLKVAGSFYGIPLHIDGLVLFYNEDILKNANVAVPVTWVDVQKAIPKLTVKESGKIVTSAIALGSGENIEHFSDILTLMMLQNGTQLGKSFFSCTEGSNCAVEALSFYYKFAESPDNTWDETLDNSIVAFAGGKVAMIIAPSWETLDIKAINRDLNFKLAPVPQLPCERQPCPSINWASYWVEGVSKKSPNQEAAWEFLKYLSLDSTLKKLYTLQMQQRKLFGAAYSRMDLAETLTDNSYLAPLLTQAPTMKSFYTASRTYDGETGLNSSLIKYLKDAVNSLSKGVSPETALKTADSGFKQVYSRFGINSSAQ